MSDLGFDELQRWWLSYAAEDRFLGGCVVMAEDFLAACVKANRTGLSPGGQVLGILIPADKWEEMRASGYRIDVLYTLDEIERTGASHSVLNLYGDPEDSPFFDSVDTPPYKEN